MDEPEKKRSRWDNWDWPSKSYAAWSDWQDCSYIMSILIGGKNGNSINGLDCGSIVLAGSCASRIIHINSENVDMWTACLVGRGDDKRRLVVSQATHESTGNLVDLIHFQTRIDQNGPAFRTFANFGSEAHSLEGNEIAIEETGNQHSTVSLANPASSLAEDANMTTRIKVADIGLADDGLRNDEDDAIDLSIKSSLTNMLDVTDVTLTFPDSDNLGNSDMKFT